MKDKFRIVYGLIVVMGILGIGGCSRQEYSNRSMPWHTGSRQLDSLLDVADGLMYARVTDEWRLLRVLGEADSVADGTTRGFRSAKILIEMLKESAMEANGLPKYHDLAGMGMVSKSENPYLRARVLLLQSQAEPDLEKKTDVLFGILPDFVDAADSMRVVETLYELNMAYGKVWDIDTQIDYMHEILNYVPDSLPELRAVVKSNVVRLQRTRTDSVSYLASLDSLRGERNLMELAPALGVTVYSDLYRLRGSESDLDSAGMYLGKLEIRHDAERVYQIQLLRHLLKIGNAGKAADIASGLARSISDEDTPLDMECMEALTDYYRSVGRAGAADSVAHRLAVAQRSADAFERAIRLSRLNADRRIADFRRYNEISRNRERHTSVWMTIGIILLVLLPPVVGSIIVLRKRHRESDSRLQSVLDDTKNDLDNTRRRLTVAEMRSAEKDRALSDLLQDLDTLPLDPEERAEEIRKRLKLQLCGNDEWERFTAVFTEMRPGFVENLKAKYPQLTRGDVRLCCLLEMGLDTKHIAQLLMIRPESVKKHRQRLRAKFGLTPDVKWPEFFATL